jgi:hypothetical protein
MDKKKIEPEVEPKVKLYLLKIEETIEAESIDEARLLAKDRVNLIDKVKIGESISRVVRAKYSSRASRLAEAETLISDAKCIVDDLKGEVEGWYENLPENFQNGEKGEQLQEAMDKLDELAQSLEEAEGHCDVEFPGMY